VISPGLFRHPNPPGPRRRAGALFLDLRQPYPGRMEWQPRSKTRWLLVLLPALYFLAILIKTSWICDDAYITFRTVDNFVHGSGLRWNIDDRVQTYTNPLWMLVVSLVYALTGEIYYPVTALMFAASLGAILLFARRIAGSPLAAAMGILILSTSKAFTDYSTSGLENPLTHLLLVIGLIVYFRPQTTDRSDGSGGRRLLALSLIFSLAMVNRMDTGLLLAPLVAAVALRRPGWAAARTVLAGMVPFWAWEIFSMIYYGFPFPNSAYAKLASGIGAGALIVQGLSYFWNSLRWDPLTLPVILVGLALSLSRRARSIALRGSEDRGETGEGSGRRIDLPVGIGILLYLLYVVRIGGDFMSGRFLAAPLLCATVVLCRHPLFPPRVRPIHFAPLVVVLGLGFLSIDPPLLSGPACGVGRTNLVDSRGISDERAYYYQGCGLLRAFEGCSLPCHFLRTRGIETKALGRQLITAEAIGLVGFYGGPGPHYVDFYGIADPLIARLPLKDKGKWRIGHVVRELPPDYLETIRTGQVVIRDVRLRKLYEDLSLIVRGPIWSHERIGAIVRMNLGGS
jgi:arabinofuranosyltransferase